MNFIKNGARLASNRSKKSWILSELLIGDDKSMDIAGSGSTIFG
jgi:hypothetical protein